MTAIQNIQTTTIHIPTAVIRKIALAMLALAGVGLLVLLALAVAPGVSYFAVLAVSLVAIAVLGVHEVNEDAKKPQFDIR